MQAIGDRIKQARQAAGLSQRGLAEKAKPLSAMAISKYEHGDAVPGSDVLLRLAKALGVKFEYFFRPVTAQITKTEYRKHSGFSARRQQALESRIIENLERYLAIEEVFGMERMPSFQNEKLDLVIKQTEDAEVAAAKLRQKWKLGEDPIDDLCEALEDHGVKVILIDEKDRKFDGFSCWANTDVAVIAVRKQGQGDRLRFDLAHELGHLFLKLGKGVNREQASHRFAAAFLVPANAVKREFPVRRTHLSPAELYSLKHKWGFSMQAWVRRLLDLGIISETYYRRVFIKFGKLGWRKQEPDKPVRPEKTRRFERLVDQALTEGLISYSRAAEILGKPPAEVRKEMKWPEEVEVA